SNLGADEIMQSVEQKGEVDEQSQNYVNMLLKQHFRPEFLNRLDEIILFKPLTKPEIVEIVDLLLNNLTKRLKEKQVSLVVTSKAKEFIVDGGYDISFGARPLKRYIQNNIETMLAKYILTNDISPNSEIVVDVEDDELIIK
ncbi:MAG: ATP-dependent Clp protease ATP-binding subunit, partial [Clostridia bacterium]|nr:ATP-dependent Clp protease ATP-binding subunit [Clostridia bacterium]